MAILHETVPVHLEKVAPTVPGDLPWVGGQGLVFPLDRSLSQIKPVGRGIDPASNTVGRFQLGTVKYAIAKHDVAHRSHRDHSAMMGIGHVDPSQDFLPDVSFAVSIGIPHEYKAWLMGNDHSVLVEGQAIRHVQPVGKDSRLVRLAIPIGILQDDNFVMRNVSRNSAGEGGHGDDPKPTQRIKGDLFGVAQFGKLPLGSKQVDLVAFRNLEVLEHLFRRRKINRFPLDHWLKGQRLVVESE